MSSGTFQSVEFVMLAFCPVVRRRGLSALLAIGLCLVLHSASAQRAIPDPAPLQNFNPLCDSSLVHCLEIDDFAAHAYGHLQVLPATQARGTAAVFPFGVTLGLFGRFAGGISTSYSFWSEGDATYQQLGPLRLSLTGRLLPLFPFFSSGGKTHTSDDGGSYYAPPSSFRFGFAYEHEVRVGPFSGVNSLGLLTDLASLALIGSKMIGPVQLSAGVGALYDWRGSFATSTVAAQLGVFLPFFKALKVYVEGMGRGFPAYVKQEALPLIPDAQDPIHPQGSIGGGLAFHPHARVDLGVTVQRGFGGIAPWSVAVHFLVISIGKTYQDRAATPIAQIAADVTKEFVSWAVEKIKAIDPYLKRDCILYDDNHQPTVKLGELSPDGKACLYQGLRVPIGPSFWHNRSDTLLCEDKALTKCFLSRSDQHAAWEPVHPLLVHSDCFAYYNGRPWMRIGKPSADKQSCENQGHVVPVGHTLAPDHSHPRYYCYDEPDKTKYQTKKLWCYEKPETPQTDGQYIDRRFAAGIDRAKDDLDRTGDRVRQTIDEGATGVPLHATTPVQEAMGAGRRAIDGLKNVTDDQAKQAFFDALTRTKEWLNKSPREQGGDLAEDAGDTLASPTTYVPAVGAAFGRGVKIAGAVGRAENAVTDAGKLGKKARKAAARAAREGDDVADHSLPGNLARTMNPSKATSPVWKEAKPFKEELRRHGDEIWAWDKLHNDIEVYDKRGRHLGSRNPTTGEMYKAAVSGRRIEL